MKPSTQRAYKRNCFQGRGTAARWLDRFFFAALGGVCLYILAGSRLLSGMLFGAILLLSAMWGKRRWNRYSDSMRREAAALLRREDWVRHEADRLRQGGGVILHPAPDKDGLKSLCLRYGTGTAFHSFGEPQDDLVRTAVAWGCIMTFHPWGEGAEPESEQVTKRLEQDAPKQKHGLWGKLLLLPANRYILAGGLLLLLSMALRRALYWRLLGSLCLLIGAFRRSFRTLTGT